MILTNVKSCWAFLRMIFLEGMLHRTESGEKLGFFTRRGTGSNLMFAGITGTLIGTVWFAQRAHFELDAMATTSEVIAVSREFTSDREAVYQLTLRWVDQDGHTQVTVPKVKANYYNVPVGTELDIKFDPNDPADVRVETEDGPWYLPRLILFSAIVSFFIGRLIRGRP